MLETALLVINAAALAYVLLVDTIYLVQLIRAAFSLNRYVRALHYREYERFDSEENMIPISLLVPACNEAATIADTVRNLLSLDFPEYEVIVINDGSRDETLEILKGEFGLVPVQQPFKRSLETAEVLGVYRTPEHPNLVVVDKVNGGKADALNAGLNLSRYPVFVSIDADSILEKGSLMRMILPFAQDHRVVGVGGIVRIASGCTVVDGELTHIGLSNKPLVNLQTVEYLRAFLTGRMGFDAMGMLLIVSGAFGAFQKQAVLRVGGYTRDCVGEDMELVIKLHKLMREEKTPYRIQFLPDPVCWTQPPERMRDLHGQRRRWQAGLIDSLVKHRGMCFNPKYGRIGMVSLPYFWLFELIGPVLELVGYLSVPIGFFLGVVSLQFFLAFFTISTLYGVVLSIGALLLEENTFRKYPSMGQLFQLMLYAIVDNLGYRQLNTLFRVEALLTYGKSKQTWGEMERKEFSKGAEE